MAKPNLYTLKYAVARTFVVLGLTHFGFSDVGRVVSNVGWEQEFFVVPARLYRQRPDLVNCGRTLIGALPTKNQQAELNYFNAVPLSVQQLMDNIQAKMLRVGSPMNVKHNEVSESKITVPFYGGKRLSWETQVT